MWKVAIVSGDQGFLEQVLNEWTADGYEVRVVTPHGLGSWTVMAFKADASAIRAYGRVSLARRLWFAIGGR